ncbi:MAG: phenylalanine--tRNA ligase subunit alpha [Clostridiales bacterium]|nr:phenylalanine--tRNA ligase subunit alpha [Clostridiales bacterium]
MKEELNKIKLACVQEIENAREVNGLEEVRVKYLGKKGELTLILRNMGNVSAEERPLIGKMVNETREEIEKELTTKKAKLEEEAILKSLENAKKIDFSIPAEDTLGSLHPITVVQREIEEIFKSMGFTVEEGFEVESEYNNFEAVNVPKYHPARDMQDTFWLENGELLKTHTSAAQNRIMRKYNGPLKAIFPGRCFRNEDLDASHENTFFQLEGMMIDKDISVSNLIYFMKIMLSEVFGKEVNVRLRPGYFPFVEPGFELDASCMYCGGKGCKVCKNSGWIELCPCGLIHPKVLEMGGINPDEYSGFAFGLGLARLAMMKYSITDIRLLNSGDLRFLKPIGLN